MKAVYCGHDNHVHAVLGRMFHRRLGSTSTGALITHGEKPVPTFSPLTPVKSFNGRGFVSHRPPALVSCLCLKLVSNLGSGRGLTGGPEDQLS